jgi:hypothetical protein
VSASLKTCSCGVSLTVDEWEALPLVGFVSDEAEVLELRNHSCGSTIALELAGGDAP